MRYTRKMVLCLTLIPFLLSGCNQHLPALNSSMALVSPSPKAEQTSQEVNPDENVQNLKEMQLVMLFRDLLRMDWQANVTITAKQAQVILPIVRKSMDEGSMIESERKQVLAGLTFEQKTFLEDQSKQVKKRMAERMDNLGDELSKEDREKRVEAFMQKRRADQQFEPGMIDHANGGNQPLDTRGLGVSVEQQLLELLMSKL
jgi:hypothetical protein